VTKKASSVWPVIIAGALTLILGAIAALLALWFFGSLD
jgi:hypothetical protein